jgi:hypothetical protein
MSAIAPSTTPVQLESLNTGNPVSESALIAMGGTVNYALANAGQVGDIVSSGLDTATFQALRNTTWILCNGQSALGTQWEALTGLSTVPQLCGAFPRGKNNGTGLDPNGELLIGTYVSDQVAAHVHSYQEPAGGSGGGSASGTSGQAPFTSTSSYGGAETAPKYSVVNFFVKVNV